MSIGDHAQQPKQLFTHFSCTCGRELRVKRELEGTEVRCWDCREMVRVPHGRSRDQIDSDILAGSLQVFHWQVLVPLVILSILSSVMLFAQPGTAELEIAIMILAAVVYGLVLAGGLGDDGDDDDGPERISPVRLALQVTAVAVFGLALALPWIYRIVNPTQLTLPFRLSSMVLLVYLVVALVGPPAMLLAFGRADRGPVIPSRVPGMFHEQPGLMLLALALFPLGVVVAELAVFVVVSLLGWLPYLLLQVFPDPESNAKSVGIHLPALVQVHGLPHPAFVKMYGLLLAEGYTLTGGIPASIIRPLNPIRYPWQVLPSDAAYLYIRIFCNSLATFTVLLALALQARWLGVLARRESEVSPT